MGYMTILKVVIADKDETACWLKVTNSSLSVVLRYRKNFFSMWVPEFAFMNAYTSTEVDQQMNQADVHSIA